LIGGAIAIGGLFIFYRALKEPADQFFSLIGRGLKAIWNGISGGTAEKIEVIRYG